MTDDAPTRPILPPAVPGARRAAAGPPEPRFAERLARMAAEADGDRITVGALGDAFGRRGHGALLVLFGLPNLIPLPLSFVTGLPLVVVAAQIALGWPRPWFPGWLRARSLATADLRRVADAMANRLGWLERLVRPRWARLTEGPARRALGCFAVVLAGALFLPLPFGNAIPGLALALIGLALLERDGAAALAGTALGLVGLMVTATASAAILGAGFVFVRGLL